MAGGVDVDINKLQVWAVLNGPAGAIFDWRDDVAEAIVRECIFLSPINNPANARHRGGIVGTFKRRWHWDRIGSNGDVVRAFIENQAGHAKYVEFGRGPSFMWEKFSWIKHKPPGAIRVHPGGTGARQGEHLLRDVVNSTMPQYVSGYTPLP